MSDMIFEYQGVMAKAPPCPERTLKTPLPQQSSPSSREGEGQWVALEDRCRRCVAFQKTAKRMLRYLEDSDDVKVGVTEVQEQLEISEEAGTSIKQKRKSSCFHSVIDGGDDSGVSEKEAGCARGDEGG